MAFRGLSAEHLFISGLAPSLSITILNPLDVVKSRAQTYVRQPRITGSNSTLSLCANLLRREGMSGMYRGLSAAVMREASLNTVRLGLFDPVMMAMHAGYHGMHGSSSSELPPLWKRAAAAMACGAVGSVLSNPLELIKCRLQCAGESARGHTFGYKGVSDAAQSIYRAEGISGFWNGSSVFVLRNLVGTGANLTTFLAVKSYILSRYGSDAAIASDVVGGLASGFAASVVMCPLDMIKTRLQNQPIDPKTGRGAIYCGWLQAMTRVVSTEGAAALYQGFTSLFFRTGPHYVLTFTIFGILQRAAARARYPDESL